MEFGRQVMFGSIGSVVPPATFKVPAGDPVSVMGSGMAATWQKEAWRLWKHVGEIHYPSTRLSRQTSMLEWRVRVNGRELTPTAARLEIERVTRGLGRQEASYLLSLNDMVAGEAWYVEQAGGNFAVWSVLEERLEEKVERARAAGRVVLRIWQPDPTNPQKADSSVRTAIGPAEELLTLEALGQAQSRSRLSQAGVIITPSEQLYAAEDPWEQNMLEAMTAAIKDVRSPSALQPIHIRMRRDLIEFVRYITFPRPYDDMIDRKQERAVIRIANALDIEPELIQGIGDSTYWNAWAVSMDTYQAHIAPRAERIGNLYAAVAERLRGGGVVIEITPDPRIMLARRSSVRDAMDGYKLGVVGPSYVREAMGATEADAPTDEEFERVMALAGRGETMDRERRVGENPGPARSNPDNASVMSDVDVAEHARKDLGLKLRDAWRNTPHRNRLSSILPSDYTCHIPLSDIEAEFDLQGGIDAIIRAAVTEIAPQEVDRLASWIMGTLELPTSGLRALEEVAS